MNVLSEIPERIGIFDSGVGGLTVVSAVREALPTCDIVYLGDTARVPYGTKSPRTVERYSLACLRFLLSHRVGLILIACNTASANALTALERESPVPVIGAVEPGAQTALRVSTNGRIGVIGTLATISSGAYTRAILQRAPHAAVTALPCPLLVPLAEEGWVDDDIAAAVAHRYLRELFARDPALDTLVLGCTHYPLLRRVLSSAAESIAGRPVSLVDSATAMAQAAHAALPGAAAERRPRGKLHLFATDISRLGELGPRFLGESLTSFELVDL